MLPINSHLLSILIGLVAALSCATLVRLVALRNAEPELRQSRMGSLRVWWILTLLTAAAAIFGRMGTAVLLAIVSAIGLREFLKLAGTQQAGRVTRALAYGAIPVQYLLIACDCDLAARTLLPSLGLLMISAGRLLTGRTTEFLRITASIYWGVMLLVFGLSHAVLLIPLAGTRQTLVGPSGWFLYLVLITELDDIAQAIVGRRLGRHRITPGISPHKTWEGLAGGLVVSVALSILLAPWLTSCPSAGVPRGLFLSAGSGLVIATTAFLGDINMSAVKRDAGVKDASSLLPGMGGMIDRIDSLTFTAPAFYYFQAALF